MKKYIQLPLLFIFFTLTIVAEESTWPQDISDLQPDPNVTFGQLDNGIRWVFMHNETPEENLSLRLVIRAGSLMENENQRGLAHFLEHMAFNGSEHFKPGELAEFGERNGMTFGADTTANTGFSRTLYKLDLPNTGEHLINKGFLYFSDVIHGLSLTSEEIDKERGVILSELNRRYNAEGLSLSQEYGFLYPLSRFPSRFPLGLKTVVQNCNSDLIRKFYHKWYTPDRCYIVGVGDLDLETFKNYLDKSFGAIPANPSPVESPPIGEFQKDRVAARVYCNPDLNNASLTILAIPGYTDVVDSENKREDSVKRYLASCILSRRFQKILTREGCPLLNASSYIYDFNNYFLNSQIVLSFDPQNWRSALQLGDQELRKTLQYGFDEVEYKEAVDHLENFLRQQLEEASTRLNKNLADGICDSLVDHEVYRSPQQSLAFFYEMKKTLSVKDLNKAFVQAWDVPSRLLYLSGDFDDYVNDADVLQAYLKSQKTEVSPNEQTEIIEWPYTSFGVPGSVVKETYVKDLDIHQYQLSNNIYLNLKQTDYTAAGVKVTVRFGSGNLALDKNQEGYEYCQYYNFLKGGLGAISWSQWKELTAGKSIKLGFGFNSNCFYFKEDSSSRDFEMGMQVLAAYFSDPGFRPESLRIFKKSFDFFENYQNKEIDSVLNSKIDRWITSDDIRFGFPDVSVFRNMDYQKSNEWFLNSLNKEHLEITIVGDIEPERALKGILNTFGCFDNREETKPDSTEHNHVGFCDPQSHEFKYETSSDKAAVGVVFKTTDCIEDLEVKGRLDLIAQIIRGRMLNTLREEMGATYSPVAYSLCSESFKDFGTLRAYTLCKSEDVERVRFAMTDLLNELRENGVSEDELNRALKSNQSNRLKSYKTNDYWRYSISGSQENPQKLEWIRSYLTDLSSVSVEGINALIDEYIDTAIALQFSVMPTSISSE